MSSSINARCLNTFHPCKELDAVDKHQLQIVGETVALSIKRIENESIRIGHQVWSACNWVVCIGRSICGRQSKRGWRKPTLRSFCSDTTPRTRSNTPSCQELGTCDDFGIYGIFAQLAGAPLTGSEKVIKALKAAKTLCRKLSEECGDWGSRITTPKGQPTTGGGVGTGFCQAVSFGILAVPTIVCTNAVNFEVNVEGCVNVTCPQV